MTNSSDFTKTVRVGKGPDGDVFCSIKFADGRLSITGVEGPKANGNASGSCGQIVDALAAVKECAPGWTFGLAAKFARVWKRWHLNDMRAGSPAQEQFLRDHPVVAVYPEDHYTKASAALAAAGLNPDNGYKYGSAWLREEVPADVLQFLADLPATDKTPAWV